ncbi:MAG: radical SAM protein [Bacteroidota bacterium]
MTKKAVILFFPLVEEKNPPNNYPWALIYLERMLRQPEMEVILIDERLHPDYADIVKNVADRLLFAGVSAMIGYQMVGGLNFSRTVRSVSHAPILWGGWFPSAFPEMALNSGYADYICVGQGEMPIKLFAEKLLRNELPHDISGIWYQREGLIIQNQNESLCNPKHYPRPNLRLFDINRLIDMNGVVGENSRGADYMASTGCPNQCGFCNLALVFGSKWYPKDMTEIIQDIRFLKEEGHISHLTFSDDNFFAAKKFVIDFCHAMVETDLDLTWEANAHIGYFLKHFSEEDVELMTRAGCRRIKIGAESGDQDVLDLIHKNIQVDDILKMVKLLQKHQIHNRIFTMVCFPGDPERDFRKTLKVICKAKLINPEIDVNVNFFKPIPKTPMFHICVSSGFSYPPTIEGLIAFFSGKFTAPWYDQDFHGQLDTFLNYYYPFTNPLFFRNFSLRKMPFAFLLNMIIYPVIVFRTRFNWMKFSSTPPWFAKIIRFKTKNSYLESVSTYKSRL